MNVALLAALGAGTLIAVQAAMVGVFGARLHPLVASTWVHVGGVVFGIVVVSLAGTGFQLQAVRQAPWGLLAGVAGVLLVAGVAVAVGGLGLATTLAVVTGTQLLLGFVLESAGLAGPRLPIDPVRLLGAALIVGGVLLVFGRAHPAA